MPCVVALPLSLPLPWIMPVAGHSPVHALKRASGLGTGEMVSTSVGLASPPSPLFQVTGLRMPVMSATDTPDHDEPGQLLLATASGDSAAFEKLYRTTSSRLFGVCLRIVPQRAEAE